MVGNEATIFQKGKCSKVADTTKWITAVKTLFESVSTFEGLVNDPFIWIKEEKLALYRD